ncbi:MAG TPA: hypothetical protein EYP03_05075 [Aquificae bacterium]|nr:hypothetical protein [Aquificota bacterium]
MNKKFYLALLCLGGLFFILALMIKLIFGNYYYFKLVLVLGIMLTLKGIVGFIISHSKKILEE